MSTISELPFVDDSPGDTALPHLSFFGTRLEAHLEMVDSVGPVYRMMFDGKEHLVISGLEANDMAWRNPDSWSYHDAMWPFRHQLSEVHVTQLDGEAHRRKRRLLKAGFKMDQIVKWIPLMAEVIAEDLAKAAGTTTELHDFIMDTLTRANSKSMINLDLTDTERAAFIKFEEEFIGALFLGDRVREFYGRPDYVKLKEDVMAYVLNLVRQRAAAQERPDDNLTAVMDERARNLDPLTEEELIYDTYLLLVAGHGNSAKTVCWALHEVMKQPEWLAALTAELEGFDATKLMRGMEAFPYLKATLLEAERMYPAAPVLPRVAAEDIDFDGFVIPAGTRVLHMQVLPHFMESIYDEPLAFKPERFLHKDPPRKAHGTFGGGTHICLGLNLTRVQMPLFLGQLLGNHKLEAYSEPRFFKVVPDHEITPIRVAFDARWQ